MNSFVSQINPDNRGDEDQLQYYFGVQTYPILSKSILEYITIGIQPAYCTLVKSERRRDNWSLMAKQLFNMNKPNLASLLFDLFENLEAGPGCDDYAHESCALMSLSATMSSSPTPAATITAPLADVIPKTKTKYVVTKYDFNKLANDDIETGELIKNVNDNDDDDDDNDHDDDDDKDYRRRR